MKAILINADQSLRWDDVPNPVLREGECLVRVAAAGVNRADLLQREGSYPPPPGCPEWMGLEIAGVVEKAGANSRWKAGDEVCALLGGGGYAQYAAVAEDMLMPVPGGMPLAHAAALPEAFATAYLNLFWEGEARAGETLLVTGGNSGLASVMIPLAKAFGLRVITTVRGAHKVQAIAPLGADVVVDTSVQPLAEVLEQELQTGRGVDIAIDCLGSETMGRCLPFLNRGARWIMIAALAGAQTQIDLKNVYVKNIRIIGSTLRSRAPQVKAHLLAELVKSVWPLVESGAVRPTIDSVLPITSAEEAHNRLYQSRSAGKIILTVPHA